MTSESSRAANSSSQPETTQAEDTKIHDPRPGGNSPRRFFKNLFFLAKATDDEVKRQARNKVKDMIENEDVMRRIKDEFKSDYKEARKEVRALKTWAIAVAILSAAFVFFAGPLIPDIFSLDVLKVEIENLKDDIESIRDN